MEPVEAFRSLYQLEETDGSISHTDIAAADGSRCSRILDLEVKCNNAIALLYLCIYLIAYVISFIMIISFIWIRFKYSNG